MGSLKGFLGTIKNIWTKKGFLGQSWGSPGRFRSTQGWFWSIPGWFRSIPGRFRSVPVSSARPGTGRTCRTPPTPSGAAGTSPGSAGSAAPAGGGVRAGHALGHAQTHLSVQRSHLDTPTPGHAQTHLSVPRPHLDTPCHTLRGHTPTRARHTLRGHTRTWTRPHRPRPHLLSHAHSTLAPPTACLCPPRPRPRPPWSRAPWCSSAPRPAGGALRHPAARGGRGRHATRSAPRMRPARPRPLAGSAPPPVGGAPGPLEKGERGEKGRGQT